MADQDNPSNFLNVSQSTKTVKVGSFQVKGHLLKWKDAENVVIHIGNISYITAADVQPPVSPLKTFIALYAILFLIGGFLAVILGMALEQGTLLSVGLIIAGIGAAGVYYIRKQPENTEKKRCLNIHMNSGNTFSIVFNDATSLDNKVLPAFEDIFEKGEGNLIFSTKDGDIVAGDKVGGDKVGGDKTNNFYN